MKFILWSARVKTDSAMDAGNLLKPSLARGELHCVGATTLDEYRQYIEKDAAILSAVSKKYLLDEPKCRKIPFLSYVV